MFAIEWSHSTFNKVIIIIIGYKPLKSFNAAAMGLTRYNIVNIIRHTELIITCEWFSILPCVPYSSFIGYLVIKIVLMYKYYQNSRATNSTEVKQVMTSICQDLKKKTMRAGNIIMQNRLKHVLWYNNKLCLHLC